MEQIKAVVIERTKSALIAIGYNQQVYLGLSKDARRELLQGKKFLVSNKAEQLDPFKEQLLGVSFRGVYVSGNWIISKANRKDIKSFIKKNLKSQVRILVQSEYGNVIKYKDKEEFLLK